MFRNDIRTEPFRVILALGDSIVEGSGLSDKSQRWVERLLDLVNKFQSVEARLVDGSVGGCVISPKSKEYDASSKPSAAECYLEITRKANPDLVIISYGLNDMRGGTPVDIFVSEVQSMIQNLKRDTSALLILTNIVHMTGFDSHNPFNQGSVEKTLLFNKQIDELARRNNCLFADIYGAMAKAEKLVLPDGVHCTALSHQLIANKIFEVLAAQCACLN